MKLPQINYGGRVGVNQTIGPQAAVRTAQQRQGVASAVYQLGEQVAEQKIEYDTNKANSAYADEISQFKRDMATRVDFTPEEVEAMGIGESVELTDPETGEPYASIPKYKVYAVALEKQMTDARERNSQGISSRKYRQAWSNVVAEEDRGELDKAVADSAVMARKYETQTMVSDITNAVTAGQYQTARDLLTKNPQLETILGPEKVNQIQSEISVAEEQQNIMAISQNATPQELQELAVQMRSDDYIAASSMNAKQLNSQANTLESLASVRTNQAKTEQTAAYNSGVDSYWQANWQNPDQLLSGMPAWFKDEDIRAVINFSTKAAKGETVTTNPATWSMLKTMSVDEPDKFANTNLLQYADKLKLTDYQALVNDQLEWKNPEIDTPSYLSNADLYKGAYVTLGIVGDKDDEYVINNILSAELDNAERALAEANKPPLTVQQKQDIVNGVVLGEVKRGKNTVSVTPFKDMKTEDMQSITTAINGTGFNVTGESTSAAKALVNKDIEVTTDNITAAYNLQQTGKIVNEKTIAMWLQRRREIGHQ